MAGKNQSTNYITGGSQDTNYPGALPVQQGIDNQSYTDLLGIQKPQILDMLVDTSNNKKDIEYYMMILALGGEKTTPNPWYAHYYNTRLWESVALQSVSASGTPGLAQAYVLATASLNPNAPYQFFPQLGQSVKFQNGVVGVITTLTGAGTTTVTITVTPMTSTGVCPSVTNTNNDQNLLIGGIVGSEASPSTYNSLTDNLFTYANRVGIIDTPFQVSGDQLSNGDFYFDSSTDGGNFAESDWKRLERNWQIRHLKAVSLHCLLGQQNTNNVYDPINTTYKLQQTNGLLTDFRNLANQYQYTPGSFQMTDWQNCNRILTSARAEEDVLMLMGYNVFQSTQTTLASYFSGTGGNMKAVQDITTMKFFGEWGTHESQSIASSINFKSIDYLGYKWHFKMMDSFNDDTTMAVAGYPGYDLFLALPFNKKQMVPVNGGGVQSMPSLMIRYKSNGRFNRKYQIVGTDGTGYSGSFGGTLTDVMSKLIRTQGGNHVLSAQQGIYGYPTASSF